MKTGLLGEGRAAGGKQVCWVKNEPLGEKWAYG